MQTSSSQVIGSILVSHIEEIVERLATCRALEMINWVRFTLAKLNLDCLERLLNSARTITRESQHVLAISEQIPGDMVKCHSRGPGTCYCETMEASRGTLNPKAFLRKVSKPRKSQRSMTPPPPGIIQKSSCPVWKWFAPISFTFLHEAKTPTRERVKVPQAACLKWNNSISQTFSSLLTGTAGSPLPRT